MTRPHILVVHVEDRPGVLNRVVSLLRRRSFNIDSITVGHSETAGISRITLLVNGDDQDIEQAGKQLYKLLEVLKVTDLTDASPVAHELALVKVATKPGTRAEILQIAQIYGARVVDAAPNTLMLEMTGPESQVDSLLAMIRPFGIRELVRTGAIAMSRSGSTVTGKGMERFGETAAD